MTTESSPRRLLIAAAIVLVAAAAAWVLVLSPKSKKADDLAGLVESQQQQLTAAKAKQAEGELARKEFPNDYRKMIVLGKAVPEGDETASLIVQISSDALRHRVGFEELTLESAGGEATETAATGQEAGPTSVPVPVPPTEAAAALLPLGATVGQANLGAMPYKLKLVGSYSSLADFIHDVERLIKTREKRLSVDGRLLTMDGFTLSPLDEGSSALLAEVGLTAYLSPPSAATDPSGLTEAAPIEGETVPTPEAATTTASPSSYPTGEAR